MEDTLVPSRDLATALAEVHIGPNSIPPDIIEEAIAIARALVLEKKRRGTAS